MPRRDCAALFGLAYREPNAPGVPSTGRNARARPRATSAPSRPGASRPRSPRPGEADPPAAADCCRIRRRRCRWQAPPLREGRSPSRMRPVQHAYPGVFCVRSPAVPRSVQDPEYSRAARKTCGSRSAVSSTGRRRCADARKAVFPRSLGEARGWQHSCFPLGNPPVSCRAGLQAILRRGDGPRRVHLAAFDGN
jgi:hypothetical protein